MASILRLRIGTRLIRGRGIHSSLPAATLPPPAVPPSRPWYAEEPSPSQSHPTAFAATKPVDMNAQELPRMPSDAPQVLKDICVQLSTSPFLEARHIRLSRPIQRELGPPQPFSRPKGRRKRGGSDHGPSVGSEPVGDLWKWNLLLQVKPGTESRGAVDHIAKVVRNAVVNMSTHIILPPKSKTRSASSEDGWAMLDLGDYAVHVLSSSARSKWFSDYYRSEKADDEISSSPLFRL